MTKQLILGAKGMLGGQLHKLLPDAIAMDRGELDVTNAGAVREKLTHMKPDCIINCVAFNDVDGAETKRDIAFLLNAEVVKNLATLANELDATLVHFSTGYVFDGAQDAYTENDMPHPLSVYAESKAAGEQEALKAARHYVIRTNVIFGPSGESEMSKKSFVDLMLGLAAKTDTIKAVSDEVNSITYAPDLAQATVAIIKGEAPYGIYHIINDGQASWYEFAKEIFAVKNLPVTVIPVSSTEFPRPAKRPARIVLANTSFPRLRPWQEALHEYLSTNP